MPIRGIRRVGLGLVALLGAAAALYFAVGHYGRKAPPGLVSGNGRIEATDVGVAAKLGGRVRDILVNDGDFVTRGQVIAHMQTDGLEAQRDEAEARRRQALAAVDSALAEVAVQQSNRLAALAEVTERESQLDAAERRFARSETLAREGAAALQELDDDRTRVSAAKAAVAASKARAAAMDAAIAAARTQVAGAQATVAAAAATVARITTDIDDATLVAPCAGRIEYRTAQPGEVLAPGGRVADLVDLSDVYMSFFVPEGVAGRLALGAEVRIVLDSAPHFVVPARIAFVAGTAQFTPKSVETANEREKLMFRVKAQIDPELLRKYLKYIKTGVPGVAWLRVDERTAWPAELRLSPGE